MNFLDKIRERQLIDESWLPILFGKKLQSKSYWDRPEPSFARLFKDVLLFYFGLIHGYCFAKAHARDCLIRELPLQAELVKTIRNIWDVSLPNQFSTPEQLFSFMIAVSKEVSVGSDLFSVDATEAIVEIKNEYIDIVANARQALDSISQDMFACLLESLPLLRTTSFDDYNMKICYQLSEGPVQIKCSPFISFLTGDKFEGRPEAVDRVTDLCYILTSVSSEDLNDRLYFDTLGINAGFGSDLQRGKERICRKVSDNENLKMLCQIVGIETVWYSVDDCWCDLSFLDRIVKTSVKILANYCGIKGNLKQHGEKPIRSSLISVLEDSKTFNERYTGEVLVRDLEGLLFDLFLEDGLFKTMRTIMLNSPDLENATSEKFFIEYLNAFVEAGVITPEKRERLKERCDEKIESSLKKLEHIVPGSSEKYKRRAWEILAEWRAFYILKAAGIRTDRLFPDVETILSIDDYYDMLMTNDDNVDNNLMRVLQMLCVFYEALLMNSDPFDEAQYFKDVETIAPKYALSKHTPDTLFASFADIAEKSLNPAYKHMKALLGRNGIASNIEALNDQYSNIKGAKNSFSSEDELREYVAGHKMFISYAHKDIDKVRPIVERWKQQGYDFFFDENMDDRFREGQDWLNKAYAAINDPECRLFVLFVSQNSVRQEGVWNEFNHAKKNERVKSNDPNLPFVVYINLEDEQSASNLVNLKALRADEIQKMRYVDVIAHNCSVESDPTKRGIAEAFWKAITNGVPNADLIAMFPEAATFDRDFHRVYCERTANDGTVVSTVNMNNVKIQVGNFYTYLKYGGGYVFYKETYDDLNAVFNDETKSISKCIFPVLASIRDAQFKRDNIAIVGYEMIRGKGRRKIYGKKILTSKRLEVDDYYCIPKYRSDNEIQKWMVDPLMIRCDKFLEILAKVRDE